MSAASVVGCMLIGTLNFGARKQHANKFLDYRICDRGQATHLLKTQLKHVPETSHVTTQSLPHALRSASAIKFLCIPPSELVYTP